MADTEALTPGKTAYLRVDVEAINITKRGVRVAISHRVIDSVGIVTRRKILVSAGEVIPETDREKILTTRIHELEALLAEAAQKRRTFGALRDWWSGPSKASSSPVSVTDDPLPPSPFD